MTQKTMTIIIGVTLVILIVFVYYYSVPHNGERIGPPIKDSTTLHVDSISHAQTIYK